MRSWTLATTVSSVISALVASVCCIGPLVLALLGIGGGALLVKFEPYRPYFMAVTFAMLGAGFYFTYRKPKTAGAVEGGPECACPAPRTHRAGTAMLAQHCHASDLAVAVRHDQAAGGDRRWGAHGAGSLRLGAGICQRG
jgi:mercuric ion transport protein